MTKRPTNENISPQVLALIESDPLSDQPIDNVGSPPGDTPQQPRSHFTPAAMSLRASVFELHAAEALSGAVLPAVRFALEVLSVRHSALVPLAERADLLHALLMCLLDGSSLRRVGATTAEAFYGLRRSTTSDSPPGVLRGLLFAVAIPYLRRRLDEWILAARGGAAAGLLPSSPRVRRRRSVRFGAHPTDPLPVRLVAYLRGARVRAADALLRWYPALTATVDAGGLACRVLYLVDSTRFYSPGLFAQGVVLRRAAPDELMASGASGGPVAVAADAAADALRYLAVAALVAFRFVQFLHAAQVRARLQCPPAPPDPPTEPPAS